MGLTIHWTLSTQRELSDAVVKELAARTKAFAQKIGCEKVLGPKGGGPDEIKLRKLPNGDTTGDFIPAESGWSVMVLPGVGSEQPAEFGLCRYPGSPHWKLTGDWKTQYAAQHGWEHFLMCHRRVISLLDLWRDFGVDVKVTDEGGFWESRSGGTPARATWHLRPVRGWDGGRAQRFARQRSKRSAGGDIQRRAL